MLFNLSCCRHFPCKTAYDAILCEFETGPCFGNTGLEPDLYVNPIYDSATDSYPNIPFRCSSKTHRKGYEIPFEGGKNMLVNMKTYHDDFYITELEVWEVKFLE